VDAPTMRCGQRLALQAGNAAARLTMPAACAAPMSSRETMAEAAVKTVKTVAEAAVKTVKTVAEAAVETMAETMVEMRKSSSYHDSGPEPKVPGRGGPVRIIKGIVVIIGIRIGIGIFGRRGNDVDLRRQSRRILGDAPAPVGLLARLHDGLLLLATHHYRNGVAGAGRVVGGRLGGGLGRCFIAGGRNDIGLRRQAGRGLHDAPAPVRLLTLPGMCLLWPSSHRQRRGDVAAIGLWFSLRQLRFAWRHCDRHGLASRARQDQRQ